MNNGPIVSGSFKYELGSAGACFVCNDIIDPVDTSYKREGICHQCATWIANHYNHAHSGEWLTWPNPVRELTRTEELRKALTFAVKKSVFERDAYRCRQCGDHKDLHCDHIRPLAKGGDNSMSNLQTLCGPCNLKKGDSHES